MKKIFPFIATLILLNGCTLSMEDFSIPEEERGMDEIYTEDTGYGEVSYQFADSVINLTENLQDQYLVRVGDENDELADSVIYISGDIPKNYRPYIGQKIFAGFGYNFPKAFSGRVIAVEDRGGIYRVTTTKVTRDDIFKHLSYKFDQTIQVENTEYLRDLDDDILERLGYQRLADSSLVNWNYYDSIQASRGNQKAKARMARRARTRGEVENETKTESSYLCNWVFDSRHITDFIKEGSVLKDIKTFQKWFDSYTDAIRNTGSSKLAKLAEWDPYIAINLKVTNYSTCHTERDENRDYECNYTDTWSTWQVGIDMGMSKNLAMSSKPSEDEIGAKATFMDELAYQLAVNGKNKLTTKEWGNMLNSLAPNKAVKKLKKKGKLMDGYEIHSYVSFGPWFAIDLEAKVTPIFELSGCLSASGTFTTAKHRSGKECYGDATYSIDKDIEKSSFHFDKFGGKFSLKLGINGRVGIDFLFAGTAGVGIGANLEAAITGEFNPTVVFDKDDGVSFKPDAKLKIYVDFWCDFRFIVKPLGFSLWEKKIADFPDPHIHIFYWSTSYTPSVYDLTAKSEIEDGTMYAYAKVQYSDLDGIWSAIGSKYYPMMKMYKGPISKGDYVYMYPVDKWESNWPINPSDLETAYNRTGKIDASFFNKEYDYYYDGDIGEEVEELHFRPALTAFDVDASELSLNWNENKSKKGNEYDVNEDYLIEVGPSAITTESSQQTFGGDNFDFDAVENGEYVSSDGSNIVGGGKSIDPNKLSMYKFATRLKVFNASRIVYNSAKLYVAIYNSRKHVICKRWVPIKDIKSGIYTYQFHFVTDWQKPEYPASGTDEILYYRVLPYWDDQTMGERKYIDSKSKKYYEIEWRKEQVNISGSKWGTVMPEIDLNQAN